jgi:hypothetical protein
MWNPPELPVLLPLTLSPIRGDAFPIELRLFKESSMSSSLKLLWRVLVVLTVGSVSTKDVDKRDINAESNK